MRWSGILEYPVALDENVRHLIAGMCRANIALINFRQDIFPDCVPEILREPVYRPGRKFFEPMLNKVLETDFLLWRRVIPDACKVEPTDEFNRLRR